MPIGNPFGRPWSWGFGAFLIRWVAWATLELAGPIAVTVLAPLFYWRIFVGDARDAATFAAGDLTELHYPYRRWVANQLARGESTWWNPFVSAGHSAIGDIQFHTLYPPDLWLAQWAGPGFPVRAFEAGIVAHVALGALFTYLLGRRLTGSRIGGLTAGIIFAFGGYLAGFPIQQMIILETSVWLPLILLCIDIGARRRLLVPYVVGAGAFALAALAGHPQTLFYVAVAAALYGLHVSGAEIRPRSLPRLGLGMLGLVVLGLGGAGLAAGGLLPALRHLTLTDRTAVTYDFVSGGFQLHEALGLVFPVQLGGAALYHGVFSLVLVALGLASPFRRANKLFWLAFGCLGLLFSFGANTFLQGPLYLALGPFKFRDHERTAFYVGLSIALLAGYGAAELGRRRAFRVGAWRAWLKWPILFAAGALALLVVGRFNSTAEPSVAGITAAIDRLVFTLLVLGLGVAILHARERRLVQPGLAGLLAVAIILFDLFSTHWRNNLTPGDPDRLFAPSPLVAYLQNYTSGQFRIASEGLLPGDGNAGALYRLEDIVGNSPLETGAYHAFDQEVPELTRWQILDVRYLVTKRTFEDSRFRLLQKDGDTNLYEVDASLRLPRAYVVDQIIPVAGQARAIDILKTEVNLRVAGIVERPAAALAEALPTTDAAFDPTSIPTTAKARPVIVTQESTGDSFTLTASSERLGLLIVSQIAYPGWSATVDGVVTPIYRVNGIVSGIGLPPGQHTVRFWFEPPGLADGLALAGRAASWLTMLVIAEVLLRLAGWLVHRWRHRRKATRQPASGQVATN